MSMVETGRGSIPAEKLGRTLIHEHILLMNMEYTYNYRPDFFAEKTINDAVSRLDALKQAGVDTIIDCTVLGLGRHMPSLAEIVLKTSLNIVFSTGAYTFDAVPSPFEFWGPGLLKDAQTEPMVDLFVKDIEQGMAGTQIRAGMLKCAIDEPGLTSGVERVMRAVARASATTGTPVTVHTAAQKEAGLVVQKVLAEEGVNLECVVIGHCGDTTDTDYLMRLADKGSILGMDRFGLDFPITPAQRVETIARMVRLGYADRLALGHDCCCWSDYFPDIGDYHAAMPNHHYLHIHDDILPALRAAGVSDADIDRMFIDNPRRLFA